MDSVGSVGLIFGVMGMSMGTMGFVFGLVAINKVAQLEKKVKNLEASSDRRDLD